MKVIALKRKIKLKDLKVSLFVRKNLDHDRVLHFAEMMENGVKFPPILVDKNGDIIDGRHRFEAMSLIELLECECDVYEFVNEAEKISLAFTSNTGGALPPTEDDIRHVIKLLLDKKIPQNQFADILKLPPSICRKLTEMVKTHEKNIRINKALRVIADDDVSLNQAAATYGVNPDDLKKKIGGRGPKKKVTTLNTFLEEFESHNRSAGQFMRGQLIKLSRLVEDGHANSNDIKLVLKRGRKNANNWLKLLDNYEKRLQQLNGSAS